MIRKSLGYKSQTAFGKTIGLSQTGYSDIERGKNKLTSQNKILLQRTHNVNIEFLENRSDQMFLDQSEDIPTLEDPKENLEHFTRENLISEINKLQTQTKTLLEVIKSQEKTIDILQDQLKQKPE